MLPIALIAWALGVGYEWNEASGCIMENYTIIVTRAAP